MSYRKANEGPIHNQLNLSRQSGKEIWIQPPVPSPKPNWSPLYRGSQPYETGPVLLPMLMNCRKKYAVTNTETDLGIIYLYFHHWLQHQRTNMYSVRLNAKVGKLQCLNNRNDTVMCQYNMVQFFMILHYTAMPVAEHKSYFKLIVMAPHYVNYVFIIGP